MPINRFNSLSPSLASAVLRDVCASRAWGAALLAGRPYRHAGELFAASDTATSALDGADLDEALDGHPPIGRPTPGDPTSAREQRGMADAPERLRERMLALNLAYQERFGHVFLICATGASAEDMLAALEERLGNAPGREREVARAELAKIHRVRLDRLLTEPEPGLGPEPEPGLGPEPEPVAGPGPGAGSEPGPRTGREPGSVAGAGPSTPAGRTIRPHEGTPS